MGVVGGLKDLLDKIGEAAYRDKVIDGHAPFLGGKALTHMSVPASSRTMNVLTSVRPLKSWGGVSGS